MVDYIIVGCGLAGIAFAETALSNGKRIRVFDNDSQNSSTVAAGLYNPVILKRFSKLQDAQQQLDELQIFYERLESKLQQTVNHKMPILRKFFSIEEQNNWFAASDKSGLSEFLSTKLISKKYTGIDSPFDYGHVLQTGFVDTAKLLKSYRDYLSANDLLDANTFDYDAIAIKDGFVAYKNIAAKHLVFAEGFGLQSNPFFNNLPLDGTKGELLIIKAAGLEVDAIIKGNVFIVPLGDDLFKVGATYNWEDKTNAPTLEGKKELIDKLSEILDCDYDIISHQAGIRPTVKDRKPLLGTHPDWSRLHILNGLGTRGVMLAPYAARILFGHIELGKPIDRELDIKRFWN
jgi:glycine oxidase